MQTRVIRFTNLFGPDELAHHLRDAGFPSTMTLGEIIEGKGVDDDDTDEEIELDCVVDEDDVIEALGDHAVLKAAAEIDDVSAKQRDIEDAIGYVRAGDLPLARIMFGRVFEGGNLEAAERALR